MCRAPREIKEVAKEIMQMGDRRQMPHSGGFILSLDWTDDILRDLKVGDQVEVLAWGACEDEAGVEIWGLDYLLPAPDDDVVGLDATASGD